MKTSLTAAKNATHGHWTVIPLALQHFGALGALISVFKNVSPGTIHTRHKINAALPGENICIKGLIGTITFFQL